MAALRHPKGAKLSDRQIAEHCGVSHATVIKIRAELESTGQIDQSPTRTGRDGRTINVANIGKASATPAEVEEYEESATYEIPPVPESTVWVGIEEEEHLQ